MKIQEGQFITIEGTCEIDYPVQLSNSRVVTDKAENVMEIDLAQAIEECSTNQLVYQRKYEGKKVRVSDKIFAIGTHPYNGRIYVRLSYKDHSIDGGINDLKDLYCFFEENEADNVMKLKKGERVTIEGIFENNLPFSLGKCRIVSGYQSSYQTQPQPAQRSAMSDAEFIELCKSGTAQQVAEAIKAGADVNAKDNDGWTALMFAAVLNKNPEVITALIKAGADINAKANGGETALDFAKNNDALKGTDVIRLLGGAPQSAQRSAMTDEEFIELCKSGTAQQVIEAIRNGANVNAKDNNGRTALMIAATLNKNPEIITALIKAGADVNAKDNDGRTALMFTAAINKNSEVITALIKAGADVNAKDNDGATALTLAAANTKNPEVITALTKAGLDVNAKGKFGWTALMIAAHNNQNPEVITALIKAGADVNAKDDDGRTVLDFARATDNTAAIKVLEDAMNFAPAQSQPQPQSNQRLSDAEYKQMLKDYPDFARADKALNAAWARAKKNMNANDFEALKREQARWISSERDKQASELMVEDDLEAGYSKPEAYTIATRARANYISHLARGERLIEAVPTGNKVNVRSKPVNGKVLFQVNAEGFALNPPIYILDCLIVDKAPVSSGGENWYRVLYHGTAPDGSDADFNYVKANGFIVGRFIKLEPIYWRTWAALGD